MKKKKLSICFVDPNVIKKALLNNTSFVGFLMEIGVPYRGVRYDPYRAFLDENGYQYSFSMHHSGRKERVRLGDVFQGLKFLGSSHLMQLFKKYDYPWVCEMCSITKWKNKKVNLTLDHINGNFNDNRFGNLRLICHNCNYSTPTFCSKNKLEKPCSENFILEREQKFASVKIMLIEANIKDIQEWENRVAAKAERLANRKPPVVRVPKEPKVKKERPPKKIRPPKKEKIVCEEGMILIKEKQYSLPTLTKRVWEVPLYELCKEYNCSDHGLKKVCQRHNIPIPPNGHWADAKTRRVVPKPAEKPRPSSIDKFTPEELQAMMWEMSITEICKRFVTDKKTMKSRYTKHNLIIPPVGYWNYSEEKRAQIKKELLG